MMSQLYLIVIGSFTLHHFRREKLSRRAKTNLTSFFSHFIRRPYPNFVSYDLSVISLKKEHKCYGIGKLIRIDSDKEQEKMMLDKVDRSSVATDLATSCQGRIGFCRFRKPFNLS